MSLFSLAHSLYPRLGFDRRNSDILPMIGPTSARTIERSYLNKKSQAFCDLPGKCIVASDNNFRVVQNGYLHSISRDGYVFWSVPLNEYNGKECFYHSFPVALEGGYTVMALGYSLLLIDKSGKLKYCFGDEDAMFDDSRCAPNITNDGELVHSSIMGFVFRIGNEHISEIGNYGYDVVPPAIYDDNTIAVSGYSMLGFAKVSLHGDIIWRSKLQDADLVPTINRSQFSAVGSVNDGVSQIFSSEGQVVGQYGQPALFSEYLDQGWIALSKNRVARLTMEGDIIWKRDIEYERSYCNSKALIDMNGRVYIPKKNELICFDEYGKKVFSMIGINYLNLFNVCYKY